MVVGGDATRVELVNACADGVTVAAGQLADRSAFAAAAAVPSGVLLVGGYDERIAIVARAYLIRPD